MEIEKKTNRFKLKQLITRLLLSHTSARVERGNDMPRHSRYVTEERRMCFNKKFLS